MSLSREQQLLAERALAKVHGLAVRYGRKWPSIERDDLVGVGSEAATRSALLFEPERDAEFDAYSFVRIRGAMFDHARQVLGRITMEERIVNQILARDEPAENVADDLFGDFHRPDSPSPEETVVSGLERQVAGLVAAYLGLASDDPEEDLEQRLDHQRLVADLRETLARLPEPDRGVVNGFHFEGKTLDELAKELGLSKRTIQRVHDRAKEWLAVQLKSVARRRRA